MNRRNGYDVMAHGPGKAISKQVAKACGLLLPRHHLLCMWREAPSLGRALARLTGAAVGAASRNK